MIRADEWAPGDRAAVARARSLELWAVALLVLYYLGRLIYFAYSVTPGIPPDEETHLGIIRLYAETVLFIEDSPESFRYGLVTHVPYLYHLLMGKLLNFNLLRLEPHVYLRLWNVALALLTLLVAFRLAVRLTDSWREHLLFVVMATNTLMLSFLSAAISYDNLVNLFSILGVYFLVSFFRAPHGGPLALLALVMLAGSLTKTTFLPMAALLLAVLVIERRRKLPSDLTALLEPLRARKARPIALLLLVTLALAANLHLYGTNLLRYGKLVPECHEVIPHESCMENRIYARNWVVARYRDDALTFDQAIRAASEIRHPGDRDHALRLLNHERAYKLSQPEPINPWNYMGLVWDQALEPTIFGIQGHLSMLKSPNDLLPYGLLLLAAFVLGVRSFRWTGSDRIWGYLAVLVVGYYVILVGVVNYRIYLATHAPFLGVQGRYVFPVILPAYLLVAHFLLRSFRPRLQTLLLVAVAAVFILGDFAYFQRNASAAWFSGRAPESTTSIGELSRRDPGSTNRAGRMAGKHA